jgi:hypothetical protein
MSYGLAWGQVTWEACAGTGVIAGTGLLGLGMAFEPPPTSARQFTKMTNAARSARMTQMILTGPILTRSSGWRPAHPSSRIRS